MLMESSLSKVRNNNVKNVKRCSHAQDVRRASTAASVPHIPNTDLFYIGTRYSGTLPCRKTCTNHSILYVQ